MSRGTIVIDEHVFPVTSVLLVGGKIIVRAELAGPLSASPAGLYELRLHGQDGAFIATMRSRMSWDRVYPGDTLTVDFAMNVDTLEPNLEEDR